MMALQRHRLNDNNYKRGDEVIQVMLEWLMEYNAENWNKYTFKVLTIGMVALATPHGEKSCV